MKEAGNLYWNMPTVAANNESGFTAFAGGKRGLGGVYNELGDKGYFWSGQISGVTSGFYRSLASGSAPITRSIDSIQNGFSVRCLKN